jgi:hypothetical protein
MPDCSIDVTAAAGAIYGSRGYYWVRSYINLIGEQIQITSAIFWIIPPRGLVRGYRPFEGTYYVLLQGRIHALTKRW